MEVILELVTSSINQFTVFSLQQTENKEAMIVTYDVLNSSGQLPEAQELSLSKSLLITAQISEVYLSCSICLIEIKFDISFL